MKRDLNNYQKILKSPGRILAATFILNFAVWFQTPLRLICHFWQDGVEKHLLRSSFSGCDIIPEEILWRKKEAFSDGVSSKKKSWHIILQNFVSSKVKIPPKANIVLYLQDLVCRLLWRCIVPLVSVVVRHLFNHCPRKLNLIFGPGKSEQGWSKPYFEN